MPLVTPQTIKNAYAVCDTANTDLDDSPGAGVQLLLTAGAQGAVVYGLKATPRGTLTATRLELYLSKDAGVTRRLIRSVLMGAHTVAVTTAIPSTDFGITESTPLRLAGGDRLYVGIGVSLAAGVVFDAQYEDL
ncbi:MAG: hypothetical protein JNK30_21945 [Phenylobacterium sp.]|uniref:hypothetical protein n=1 Tax=Phenylobacterium sp. TaxID=1871053 RepID=UPI001A62CE12|nr:hypothetical protein [Phenylobacterium sp.]MBL8774065.1 hypothetical protein [Phenylobacterium sp.]